MKNFEKYEKELKNNLGVWFGVNFETEKPVKCEELDCAEKCKFLQKSCWEARLRWLFEEYKEPKTKGEQMLEELGFIKGINMGVVIESWVSEENDIYYYENGSVSVNTFELNVINAVAQRGKELFNE